MGGWAMVDPDDVVHRRPNKRFIKGYFCYIVIVQMGRPYVVICIRYYYVIFPRYRKRYICASKILTHVPNQFLLYNVGKLWSDVYTTVGRRSDVWWVKGDNENSRD